MKPWPAHFQFKNFWKITFLCVALLLNLAAPARAENGKITNQTAQADESEPYISPTNGLGSWIWASNTFNGQTCQLWRTFEIPATAKIAKARLVLTVDNEFTLYLDGRELGGGDDWRELFVFDLSQILTPGKHVLAVRAMNSFQIAGMLFGLRVDLADGRVIQVQSDASWKIVPEDVRRWEKRAEPLTTWPAATIIAPFGSGLWWSYQGQYSMCLCHVAQVRIIVR